MDSFIDVDRAVKDVDWAKAGTEAGLEMLESFCDTAGSNILQPIGTIPQRKL